MSATNTTAPDSICLIRLSAIGDCCHVLPVIHTLQHAFPNTPVTWIIGKTEHRLMEGMQGIEFIIFDKSQGWRSWLALKKQLRGRRFPVLLNMHASMRANFVSTAVDAQRRIGFDRVRARDYQWLFCNDRIPHAPQQHVCDAMLGFARHLGIREEIIDWSIPLADADRAYARKTLAHDGPVCVISPCSSQRARNFRNWSLDNYRKVIDTLAHEYGAKIFLTGANTQIEQEYAAALQQHGAGSVVDLNGKTSLKQLVAIYAAADLVIAPDSGPVHMATAVGTPVIGLYATSNPLRTGPFRDPLELTVNRYPEAAQAEFAKSVSELRWGQRVRNPDAMNLITADEVAAKIARALAEPDSLEAI
jgi:heptosyltransferase I